ncbi:hypothetical protein WS96_00580 [Burkholderia sp. MSMB1835]|nr:hypothetical protein WS96_00580 [Burkholderia sp. MSMB1835]
MRGQQLGNIRLRFRVAEIGGLSEITQCQLGILSQSISCFEIVSDVVIARWNALLDQSHGKRHRFLRCVG